MYQDPHRWSLTFQTYVQLTMVKMRTAKQQRPIRLTERSIYSAKYCFVQNLYNCGYMPHSEYTVLTEWFQWLIENLELNLDLIVYLRTSPENCLKRIKERNRSEEAGITAEFLDVLHRLHEDWLIHKQFEVPAKVLVLDGDLSLHDMCKMFDEKKDEILLKNNSHSNCSLQVDTIS
ncbi:thymidine kinase 2, mitochondrial-like isoform X2 [Ptychodera flava]